MPRRVTLPGAAELFGPTDTAKPEVVSAEGFSSDSDVDRVESGSDASRVGSSEAASGETVATNSGRVRHDEKITVYVSRAELLSLEQARIELRGDHNLAVDRGRIVRAAVALALEGFASSGADSDLARRLAS